MINLKSISNMYDEEINEDAELRTELLKELKDIDFYTSPYKDRTEMSTSELFNVYKMLKEIKKI